MTLALKAYRPSLAGGGLSENGGCVPSPTYFSHLKNSTLPIRDSDGRGGVHGGVATILRGIDVELGELDDGVGGGGRRSRGGMRSSEPSARDQRTEGEGYRAGEEVHFVEIINKKIPVLLDTLISQLLNAEQSGVERPDGVR